MFRVNSLVLVIIGVGLAACATRPIEPIPKRITVPNHEQVLLLESAVPCSDPASSSEAKKISEWKYGCYCGKGYPVYSDDNDYYRYLPKDEIDSMCRDHDICWTKFDNNDGQCNADLVRRATYLDQAFTYYKMLDCANAASHIRAAFISIVVEDKYKDNPGATTGSKVGKAISIPLFALGAPFHLLLVQKYGFPDRHRECNVPSEGHARK